MNILPLEEESRQYIHRGRGIHYHKNKEGNIMNKEIQDIIESLPIIEQMTGPNGSVKNQLLIRFDRGSVFQSYYTIIAAKIAGKVYLDYDWDYSKTTGKYRKIYLRESKAETLKKIKSGEYIVTDLNRRGHQW